MKSELEKGLIASKLRSVISLVDKLRDIQLESYIKLPKIVAVGSQSSGKSSLVEQIVGLDFLPRGSGVVTRRPLEIRMIYQKDLAAPYGLFAQLPGQKITDFSKVRESIEILTDKVCGKQKNIVDNPIILDVYSADCPNLTIIDLPGLTRIAIEGQDKDIHKITSKMIEKYMMEPSTIILCVIPANQDITNDEVLHMARKIDPSGERTIGCITKIDIMDRGTDARQLLLNKQVHLKLGFVGIKNRSQADINEKKTVQQSLKEEKLYFSSSPIYSSLPPTSVGTTSLVATLTRVLTDSISAFIPELLEKIRSRKAELAAVVKKYGEPLPSTPQQKQALIWKMCSLFMNEYEKCLGGQIGTLKCGQKLLKTSTHMREQFTLTLEQEFNYKPAESLTDEKILFALRKFDSSSNMPGFPSISAFLSLLNPLIQKLRFPLEQTLTNVYDSLLHIADLIIADVAHEYTEFREHVNSLVGQILHKHKKLSESFLNTMMEAEVNYVYTNSPAFELMINSSTPASEMTESAKKHPMILVLRKRVDSYYKVVVKNLRDLIPKNIKYYLIQEATRKMEFEIFQNLTENDKVDSYLKIDEASKSERMRHEHQFAVISQAEQFILTNTSLPSLRRAEAQKRVMARFKELDTAAKDSAKRKDNKVIKNGDPPKPTEPSPEKKDNAKQKEPSSKKQEPPSDGGERKSENKPKQTLWANLFGSAPKTDPPKPNQLPASEPSAPQKKPEPKPEPKPESSPAAKPKEQNSKSSFNDMFGLGEKKKPIPTIEEEDEDGAGTLTNKYNREVGKATDKAVDSLYADERFKQKSKQAVADGTSAAVTKKFGVSEETGKSVGKGAAWLFGQDATQNYLKEETKKSARSHTMFPAKK